MLHHIQVKLSLLEDLYLMLLQKLIDKDLACCKEVANANPANPDSEKPQPANAKVAA